MINKTKILVSLTSLILFSNVAMAELIDSSYRRLAIENNSQDIQSNSDVKFSQSSHISNSTQGLPSISLNGTDTFPKEVYDGFWAMTKTIDGISQTVEFNNGFIYIHQFKCNPNGTIDKLKTYSYELEPDANGMGLKRPDGSHYSALRVVSLEPKKSLLMHQSFIANLELKKVMPNGIDLQYIYTPTLAPLCPSFNSN